MHEKFGGYRGVEYGANGGAWVIARGVGTDGYVPPVDNDSATGTRKDLQANTQPRTLQTVEFIPGLTRRVDGAYRHAVNLVVPSGVARSVVLVELLQELNMQVVGNKQLLSAIDESEPGTGLQFGAPIIGAFLTVNFVPEGAATSSPHEVSDFSYTEVRLTVS